LQDLVRAGSELAMARDVAASLRARLGRKKLERRDLRFQMEALKRQLEQVNRSSTVDMEIWHEEAHRVSMKIQTALEAIAPVAKRISAHFAAYPALRERLVEDRASITLA